MYECPNCGRNLKFDINLQKMHCEYCDTAMDPYEAENVRQVEEHSITTSAEGSDELIEVKILTCPQCGGEIICEDNEAATFCSFCGASTMLEARYAGVKRPEAIIPFSKTKEDCKKSYINMMRRAIFAPKDVKSVSHVDGFRGIYMPYWVYDYGVHQNVTYKGKKEHQKGDYLYTDHYELKARVDSDYEGIAFDASSTYADSLSAAIAPFDAKAKKPFTSAYMSGYYADVCDIDKDLYRRDGAQAVSDDVADRIGKNSVSRQYNTKDSEISKAVSVRTDKRTLAMFPVWFMSYRKKDASGKERVLYSVVNAQTGKAAADIPVSIPKFLIGSILLAIVLFGIMSLFFIIKPIPVLVIACLLSLVLSVMVNSQAEKIADWEACRDDKGLMTTLYGPKRKWKRRKKAKLSLAEYAPIIICFIIAILLIIFRPISDAFYYAAVIVTALCDIYLLVDLIAKYNGLTSRPLPQFRRTGGDDSAK